MNTDRIWQAKAAPDSAVQALPNPPPENHPTAKNNE